MSKNRFFKLSGHQNKHGGKFIISFDKKTFRKICASIGAILAICFIYLIDDPDYKTVNPLETTETEYIDNIDESENVDDIDKTEDINDIKIIDESEWSLDSYINYYNEFSANIKPNSERPFLDSEYTEDENNAKNEASKTEENWGENPTIEEIQGVINEREKVCDKKPNASLCRLIARNYEKLSQCNGIDVNNSISQAELYHLQEIYYINDGELVSSLYNMGKFYINANEWNPSQTEYYCIKGQACIDMCLDVAKYTDMNNLDFNTEHILLHKIKLLAQSYKNMKLLSQDKELHEYLEQCCRDTLSQMTPAGATYENAKKELDNANITY